MCQKFIELYEILQNISENLFGNLHCIFTLIKNILFLMYAFT